MKKPLVPGRKSPRLFYAVATALLCSAVSHAPPAVASPDRVPCGLLNEIRGSLNDDISAGIDGVRTVIGSPYAVGAMQKRDAEVKLASISHGVHYMQDLNGNDLVPGLAPMLTDLSRASDDMHNAVEALFQISDSGFGYGFGSSGVTVSLAWPQPSTWAAIDYADQKKNAIYGLVNGLQGSCLP